MALRNLEMERAKFALEQVQNARSPMGKDLKYYKSYTEGLPALIYNSGLTGAMAFIKSKGKDKGKEQAYKLLYRSINSWLRRPENQMLISNENDLVRALIHADSLDTRLLTRETLNLISWLKKIAKAEIAETAKP